MRECRSTSPTHARATMALPTFQYIAAPSLPSSVKRIAALPLGSTPARRPAVNVVPSTQAM